MWLISFPMLLLLSVTAATLVMVALLARRSSRRYSSGLKLPPGNMGWPLVGTTFSLLRRHSATTLGDFMSHNISRYGKIFSTNLFGDLAVVSADPDLNRLVLQNEMRLFEHAWPPHYKRLMGDYSLLFAMGDPHKHQRSFVLNFLSGARIHTFFFHKAQELASTILCSWRDRPVIYAIYEARKFAFSLIVKAVLGLALADPKTEKLMTEFVEFTEGLHSVPVNLPGTKYRRALQAKAYIVDFIGKEYKGRMEKMAHGGDCSDAGEEDHLDWLMRNTRLSCNEMTDIVRGLIVAAHETTPRALLLAVYFLQRCPAALEQLREEHLQLIQTNKLQGGREPTWDDYKNLPFTQCVILETMRLGNVGRFLRKKASVEVEYKGYVIPRGATVIVHLAAVHLGTLLCLKIQSNLFHGDGCSSGIKKSNNWMPFGGGCRKCVGIELTKMEMTLFLHHLILNYDWKPLEADHPIACPILNFMEGLPIKVWERSSYTSKLDERAELHS